MRTLTKIKPKLLLLDLFFNPRVYFYESILANSREKAPLKLNELRIEPVKSKYTFKCKIFEICGCEESVKNYLRQLGIGEKDNNQENLSLRIILLLCPLYFKGCSTGYIL